jgi:hypothetical protein
MSNGFLTWSAWECGKIGNSKEGLAHRVEQTEASAAGFRVVGHDHDRLEEAVDRGPESQKVA